MEHGMTTEEIEMDRVMVRDQRIRFKFRNGVSIIEIARTCIDTKRYAETDDEKVAVVQRVLGWL